MPYNQSVLPHTGRFASVNEERSDADIPNVGGWKDIAPRHSMAYRMQHRVRNTVIYVLVAALAFVGTAAAATLLDINGTIKDGEVKIIPQKGQQEPKLIDPNAGKPIELLVMGQDTRDGADNASIGGGDTSEGSHQADTTMVVQISADRSYINLVSIPRDSLVDAPSCETSKGTISAQYNVMFNSIFANGYTTGDDLASAASCTVNAVNSLTGLNIQNFIVVDFNGLKDMINAIGGVKICIPSDVKDPYTGLDLTKGLHQLDGLAATQYARTRYSLGDGSDVQRTTRQQYLIKQLLQQALDKNIFTHTSELYQLAKSALKSLNISQGLADTATLAGLAMSLKNLNVSHMYTRTLPVVQAPSDPNRVVWDSSADELWTKMREGKPFVEQPAQDSSSSDSTNTNNDSSNTSGQAQDSTPSNQDNAQATPQNTRVADGVEKTADGKYIDTATGGEIDTETGAVKDINTGQVLGISEAYLNNVVCPVQ